MIIRNRKEGFIRADLTASCRLLFVDLRFKVVDLRFKVEEKDEFSKIKLKKEITHK